MTTQAQLNAAGTDALALTTFMTAQAGTANRLQPDDRAACLSDA